MSKLDSIIRLDYMECSNLFDGVFGAILEGTSLCNREIEPIDELLPCL